MAQSTNIDLNKLDYGQPFDIGFRMTVAYHVGTDGCFVRLDFKYNHKQFGVALLTTLPHIPTHGVSEFKKDEMITPEKGIENCINLQTSKPELLRALKELVSDLENS